MKKPSLIRIEVLILLYQYDFYLQNLKFLNYNTKPQSLVFFQKIIPKITLIDEIIQKNLYNYQLKRLNKIDQAILRLATFELLENKITASIIIDEALELTKKYSELDDEKQHKFNNKVLDQIYHSLKSQINHLEFKKISENHI
ncbi:transcription antitermination protein NusB [Candidatus Phytoplasma prunorum]|uniref:transcription antitermination protein NusB n=1 Tax=Candidatus Phytoplasma prunorum TaxID=47565 RepID=UPI002FEF4288